MNRHNPPIYAVPFGADFLGAILDLALEHGPDLHTVDFLFPNVRAGRYLLRDLASRPDLPRPLLEPSVVTVSGIFARLHRELAGRPLWNAGLLDRAGLLFECLKETGGAEFLGPEGQGDDPTAFFFPWGFRLAELFDECPANGLRPVDIPHAEASPCAARLLERLGGLFAVYERKMRERDWTTPGLDALAVYLALRQGDDPLAALAGGRRLYAAGFHTLTRPEEALLHALRVDYGACAVIRADLPREKAHWSCAPLFAWVEREKAVLRPLAPKTRRAAGRLAFVQGFDLHSQLAALREAFPRPSPAGQDTAGMPGARFSADTAVVLPSGDLLMPLLHHLPAEEINISMGYPLARSPLFRLVDTILRLEEGRKGRERHWRNILELLRHPALAGLDPEPLPTPAPPDSEDSPGAPDPEGENAPVPEPTGDIRRELHLFEETLRAAGAAYIDPEALWEEILASRAPDEAVPEPSARLVREIFRCCLGNFETPRTPHEAGKALEALCALLLRHGAHLWPRFPIDAECLYRLLQGLIPELLHSTASRLRLPREALFALIRKLLEAERVPFEADPPTGVQVLGMLETRLLSFRRVFVLDAGEHSLPGLPEGDPLLPDLLRPVLGLPDRHSAEAPAAHHFFSLIRGADETMLLWREGGEAGALFDGKKIKSRFVEELLWEEEKRLGRRLSGTGDDGPLRVLVDAPAPIRAAPGPVPVSPAARALLDDLLARPISASLLDAFLLCPARFFHERLLRLREAEAPAEEYDPPAVGVLLHRALEAYYRERLGVPQAAGSELPASAADELCALFLARPEFADLERRLPFDALTMIRVAGPERLRRFLAAQPAGIPLALEQTYAAPLAAGGRHFSLTGTLDRLDKRDEGHTVLDYKTGKIPLVDKGVWLDEAFWSRLETTDPADPRLPEIISAGFESVQLPLYLYLAGHAPGAPGAAQAAWVELAASGLETPLFGPKIPFKARTTALAENIPQLLGIILQNLAGCEIFLPRPGLHCRWCSCKSACMILAAE